MLEVIAQRDAEDFLGLALPDDEALEMARDVGGLEPEAERRFRWRGGLGDAGLGGRVVLRGARPAQPPGHPVGDRAEGIGMTASGRGHGAER